jgi:hypothetical protein
MTNPSPATHTCTIFASITISHERAKNPILHAYCKATAKRLNNDRLAEESAIRNWDQDVNNYLRKASDSLKLAQLDPQERAGLRGKVFTLSGGMLILHKSK